MFIEWRTRREWLRSARNCNFHGNRSAAVSQLAMKKIMRSCAYLRDDFYSESVALSLGGVLGRRLVAARVRLTCCTSTHFFSLSPSRFWSIVSHRFTSLATLTSSNCVSFRKLQSFPTLTDRIEIMTVSFTFR